MDRFGHIRRMTDDTGLLEHAVGTVPRRKEGYSTDDQARALWMCLEWLPYADGREAAELRRWIDIYLAFLHWVQLDNGHFHNNVAYDRSWEEETPSDDCLGRCLWACALAATRLEREEQRTAAKAMLDKALTRLPQLRYPRGKAYAIAALGRLAAHSSRERERLAGELARLAGELLAAYRAQASCGWRWFEPIVSYSNGLLPWGMLYAYEALRRPEWLEAATDSLDFLISLSVAPEGHIRPVGNRGWCTRSKRAAWDQQPIDVMKLALAAAKAHELTGRRSYAELLGKCRDWFHGANDGRQPMVGADGGCFDGLGEAGANLNQGAESTLAYLLTEALFHKSITCKSEEDMYANSTA